MGMLRRWYGRYLVWTKLETVQAWDRRAAGGLLFALVLFLLVLAVQWVPEWQVRRAGVHATDVAERPFTQADVAGLQNEMRKTFIQVVGGLFVVIGVWLTYRRTKVAEQGHITDRYTKAIEQLGALTSEGKPNVEVRLGAIYALERIAFDSPRDHWTIMEVLTAYVRQNAPAPVDELTEEENRRAIAKGPATDIHAILMVLGRRRYERECERQQLDLSRTDLRGGNFYKAHLIRANFHSSFMDGARFQGVHADGAVFEKAHLNNASFFEASAGHARFAEAHIRAASFNEAHLQHASFFSTQGERAFFLNANLAGGRFDWAHMEGAIFINAHLDGAMFQGAHVKHARFTGAYALDAEQIRGAHDWQKASFDEEFTQELGLVGEPEKISDETSAC